MFSDLNENNFMMYCIKCYSTPNCVMSEFEGDIKRTKYLKRLFRRYRLTGILKERLILNHLILLTNVFGIEATARIMFYRIDKDNYSVLKTFMVYLDILPETISGIEGKTIYTSDIPLDMVIVKKLGVI